MAGTRIAGVRRRNEPGPGPTMNGVTIQAESHGSQFDARHAKGACDARRASGTSATGRRQASCGWAGPADARGARHRSRERPDQGDLARYYVQAAPLMRPYLKGRPVSLVRAPSGIGGDLFSSATWMPRCRRASVAGVPVSGASALAGAADAEGGAGGGPDECHRIPHLERREDGHRQAGPHRVRPGPGRGRALGERRAGGGCCARC